MPHYSPDNIERKTLSIGEWAKIYGVSARMAYRLAKEERIPGLIKIGGRYVISRRVVEESLRSNETIRIA